MLLIRISPDDFESPTISQRIKSLTRRTWCSKKFEILVTLTNAEIELNITIYLPSFIGIPEEFNAVFPLFENDS